MKTLILDLKRNLFLIVVMWGATISIGMSLVSSKKAYAQEDVKSKIQHKERLEWEKHQKELIKLERLHNSQTRWGKIYDIQNLTASLFVDETTSRLPVDSDDSRAVDFGDVDGDNDFDIIVANDGQNKLYINDGTGHFVDETSSRLPNDNFASFDVELGDVDNDGDLDIFVTNEF
ncbi:MAG: FG-GAP repeat domain-containing protein, partial [bacterium]